jgi:undecaprenyl-diphosphatase
MDFVEAIILGLIQGATEFLPISSSGHLLLVPSLFNLSEPSLSLVAFVHEGTLLAVLVYFRLELWRIVKSVVNGVRAGQPLANRDARLGWFIVVGSVPAGLAGLALEDFFDEIFGTPMAAAVFLFFTAALLVAGERLLAGKEGNRSHLNGSHKDAAMMGWLDAIVIGLAQMLALLPGISRSGSTIAAGLWRGLDRATAARYSFLLGVPAILGAGVLAAPDFGLMGSGLESKQLALLIVSFFSAAITGYVCIHFLLSWLQRRSLYVFAGYCVLITLAR